MLYRIAILAAALVVGSVGMATDALARGGGGGSAAGWALVTLGEWANVTSAADPFASITGIIEVGERRTDTMAGTAVTMIHRLSRPTSSPPIQPRLYPHVKAVRTRVAARRLTRFHRNAGARLPSTLCAADGW
jgi:hypothetical protein